MKVLKIILKRLHIIILIIGLVILQANCDLKLPEYTADIINVGIVNNGIESSVPKVISEEDFNKILLLLSDSDKEVLFDNYKQLNINYYEDYEIEFIISRYDVTNDVYIKYTENDLTEIFNRVNILYTLFATDMREINGVDAYNYFESLDDDIKENILTIYESEFNKNLNEDSKYSVLINTVLIYYNNVSLNLGSIQFNYILSKGIMMILIACAAMLLTLTIVFLSAKTSAGICREFRSKVVNKAINFSSFEYEKLTTSSLITRSTNDIQQVQSFIVIVLRLIFYAPILGIGAYMKVSGNQMNFIIILAIVSVLIVISILLVVAMPKFRSIQTKIDKLNLITRELLTGVSVIRAFSTEKYEEKRFDVANVDLTKTTRFVDRIMSAMFPVMMFIMNGVAILVVWFGAKYVDSGSMQIGDILATITYSIQIIMAFLMFSMISVIMPRAIVALKRISEVLNTNTSINNIDEPSKPKINGVLEFNNVSFKYDGASDMVLDNLSFKAKKGTVTAIVGSTGSGKSTILNLIPRLYDPLMGTISIDGINIRDIDLEFLRNNIGYVPQKNMLFSGTINSNIAFGLNRIEKIKIKNASLIAQADKFINKKDKGYDSVVSQGGINFSGGQKQRIAIARAIAKSPKIYLFDDSFSALDFKTDVKVRKELRKVATDAIILIVAQRISTIMNAEQILVLDEGKLVGVGTHEELLKKCKIYKEIATSQLSKEEL